MLLSKKKTRCWKRYTDENRSREEREKDFKDYKQIRNQLRKATRAASRSFEADLVENIGQNPKAFWRYANSKVKSKSHIVSLMKEDGQPAQTDSEMANILNEYFSSVFTQEDLQNIPYIQVPLRMDLPTLSKVNILVSDVENKLKKLNTNKSPGPDGTHPKVMKELAETIAEPLTLIYNKSMQESKLPLDWKRGTVVPLHKKGSRTQASNYRPISLTSVAGKLMEKVIRDAIITHLLSNHLLSQNQHGFTPGRTCATQLLCVLEEWSRWLDEGKVIDVIYLDFKKAFDSVPHERLLLKLEAHGLEGKLLNWIRAFLTGRVQSVFVNGESSNWSPVTSGIPQGSVLGPVLFLVYINDLPLDVRKSKVALFADDTKLYNTVSTPAQINDLQDDLNNLHRWSERWQLPFNEDKCKVLHIGKRNPEGNYHMQGKHLQSVKAEKDLGVTIDCQLKFHQHISSAVSKGYQLLGIMKRTFSKLDKTTLPILFKTLIRPHLEYGSVLWHSRFKEDAKKIERVQRRATKLVREIKDLPYQERLKYMNMYSLFYRRRRGDMIAVHQIMHGLVDIPQDHFFSQPASRSRSTRGHCLKIQKEHCRLDVRSKSFSRRIIQDWNSLPENIVVLATTDQFKRHIDKHWWEYRFDLP